MEIRHRGAVFKLHPESVHDVRMAMLLSGGRTYEPATLQVVLGALQPGSAFVDVGANNGYFAVLAARRVGTSGTVLAFEPNPSAFRRLKENVSANHLSNVTCYEAGLSDRPELATLGLTALDDGCGSLHVKRGTRIPVRLIVGDSLLAGRRIDVVKVDVEGHELQVLHGLTNSIRSPESPLLIVEWNMSHAGTELLDELRAFSTVYTIARTGSGRVKLSLVGGHYDLGENCNLLAVPRSNQRWCKWVDDVLRGVSTLDFPVPPSSQLVSQPSRI